MSAAENAQRVQAAAWQSVAALPDAETTTPEDLAGWAHVARAAAPLLQSAGRVELAESLMQTARAIPARPAASAHPTGHLMELSRAIQDLGADLDREPAARDAGVEVVVTAVQAVAMTGAEHAHAAPNPQVRQLSTRLAGVATSASATITDRRTRAVTARQRPARAARPTAQAPAESRAASRRDDGPRASQETHGGPRIR